MSQARFIALFEARVALSRRRAWLEGASGVGKESTRVPTPIAALWACHTGQRDELIADQGAQEPCP